MRFLGKNEKNENFYFVFQGVILSLHETKKLGFGFLSGSIGVIILFFIPFRFNKYAIFLFLCLFFCVGYFVIAPKFYKNHSQPTVKSKHK